MAAAITRGVVAAQKRSLTATRIASVDQAIIQFVIGNKRLPCPANGTLPSTHNDVGLEIRTVSNECGPVAGANSMQGGVVPWRTLGLTEGDTTDGWDRRLTYRIDPRLALNNGMDMSWCDPAGNEALPALPVASPPSCSQMCTSANLINCTRPIAFLRARGLVVRNVAGVVLMDPEPLSTDAPTGAAYVVISHGEFGGGAYLGSGQLFVSSIAPGLQEARNFANLPYEAKPPANYLEMYYVDDTTSDGADTLHFDDVVSRPSVHTVATRAGLGPRAH
jgi:hypothetical protein